MRYFFLLSIFCLSGYAMQKEGDEGAPKRTHTRRVPTPIVWHAAADDLPASSTPDVIVLKDVQEENLEGISSVMVVAPYEIQDYVELVFEEFVGKK